MAILKGRGVTIDTVDLKADLQSFKTETLKEAARLADESLTAMIRAINYQSTLRKEVVTPYLNLTVVSSGTKNEPLKNAKPFITTKNGKVIATVRHRDPKSGANIFNILDAGSQTKEVTKKIVFPAYIGNLIPVNDPDMGDPDRVFQALDPVIIAFDDDTKRPKFVYKKPGDTIAGFEGKKLYLQVARYVSDQLVEQHIVNKSRRSFLRLKRRDIVIKVSK